PADIGVVAASFKSPGLQFRHRRLEPARADVDAGETRALPPKALGDCKADPARCASNDANAVLQAQAHALAFCNALANAFALSRSATCRPWPAGVFGKSSTISIRSGQYCLATLCSAM